ncbi:MAG: AAA family ATPase [Pseudomonadota bacterium]
MDYYKMLDLTKEPFSNSPDPAFFFQSQQHIHILQKLELAIRLRRGLNVVVGEVGTGKTTLCRQLIRRFDGDPMVETHLLLDSHMDNPMEFLATVARLFGESIPESGANEWQIKERIKQRLFSKGVDENKVVVLILDEGQNIPTFGLELLREFLNYETNEFKLLQIIIFAQREFELVIQGHPNFTDRINYYHALTNFDFQETRAMILFRLRQASKDGSLPVTFTYLAFCALYRATGGYPRKIIHLCHKVLLALIIQNRSRANWSLISACTRQGVPAQIKRWHWGWAGVGGLAALVALIFWQWTPEQHEVSQSIQEPRLASNTIETGQYRWRSNIQPARTEEEVQEETNKKIEMSPVSEPKEKSASRVAGLTALSMPRVSHAAPVAAEDYRHEEVKTKLLEKIRRARHKDYWRVVFQFEDTVAIDQPVVKGKETFIKLKGVTTNLDTFHKFNKFPSWVALKKVENDLEARIGLPDSFSGLNYFFLKKPDRLVVDLYHTDGKS